MDIRRWLNARGLTNEIIDLNYIGWNGQAITIPIFDEGGNFSFFKYRKDPKNTGDGPKYWYEKGHDAMLYSPRPANISTGIIITEGEFDAMVLQGRGFVAVSSTGGAGTFPQAWIDRIKAIQNIYICYDHDQAGRKGSVKLMIMMPHAKLLLLPAEVGDHGDVTDYFIKLGHSAEDFDALIAEAKSYPLFREITGPEQLENLYTLYERLLAPPIKYSLQWLSDAFLDYYKELKEYYTPKTKPKRLASDDDVQAAKKVPITNYYTGKLKKSIGSRLMGPCPFHNEKTASFVIYTDKNDFHCYGCDAHGDSIEFISKLNGLSFKAAIKFLLNK